jgi:hypothetical protein
MSIARIIMENLPQNQIPKHLDVTASSVFHDLASTGKVTTMREVFDIFKELEKTQDLVIFSNGTVVATGKGLKGYA